MTDKNSGPLDRLFETIQGRRGGDVQASYTAHLLAEGPEAIAAKVTEEAAETVAAALAESAARTAAESADLLYHLLVLWAAVGVSPSDVWAELARRQGTSGLAEKRARKNRSGTDKG